MKILLANPHGFCAGVVASISSLSRALELYGPPIYAFHEIVHNKRVVDEFRTRGVVFVDDLKHVPRGAVVLFSAHGVSPEVRKSARLKGLRAIDATCPLVSKVHAEARRFVDKGYTVTFIGHAGHDEAVGVLGEAPGRITLLETADDVDQLKVPQATKVAYLTQTTLSVDDAQVIIDRLKQRFPDAIGPPKDDICYATQNRQNAVKALLPSADAVLVLGSKNSSNSNRLVDVARASGKPAMLVDGADDIDTEWLEGVETLLVTAGASAPEEAVEDCLSFFRERYGAVVEQQAAAPETVSFPLPVELRGDLGALAVPGH